MYTHPFFEATPPGAAPGPPVKTGARVRLLRECKKGHRIMAPNNKNKCLIKFPRGPIREAGMFSRQKHRGCRSGPPADGPGLSLKA